MEEDSLKLPRDDLLIILRVIFQFHVLDQRSFHATVLPTHCVTCDRGIMQLFGDSIWADQSKCSPLDVTSWWGYALSKRYALVQPPILFPGRLRSFEIASRIHSTRTARGTFSGVCSIEFFEPVSLSGFPRAKGI